MNREISLLSSMRDRFYEGVTDIRPNEWELDEALEQLLVLPDEKRQALLDQVGVVWPISHSLCFQFLEHGVAYIASHGSEDLAEWIRQILSCYERHGLRGARIFMAESVSHSAADAVRLASVRGRLLPFLRGVSGMMVDIQPAPVPWTDTSTVFLPEELQLLPRKAENERMYVFLACCQWAYIRMGMFAGEPFEYSGPDGDPELVNSSPLLAAEQACQNYPDPELARVLLHFQQFCRAVRLLEAELPGLMRQVRPLLATLAGKGRAALGVSEDNCFLPLLEDLFAAPTPGIDIEGSQKIRFECGMTLDHLSRLYPRFSRAAINHWRQWRAIAGEADFAAVRERIQRRRREEREAAIRQLAKLITRHKEDDKRPRNEKEQGGNVPGKTDGASLVVDLKSSRKRDGGHELQLNTMTVELPAELSELLKAIARDLGHVPEGYVQAAAGIAGQGVAAGEGGGDRAGERDTLPAGIPYDEWDFRRRGYRRHWCTLVEKELRPVRSLFVDNALARHRGLLARLRRQFESLRTQHHFARRRRYGDDIDFDALVEAAGDRLAGIAPSERLFVRLIRDTRDIGVMFLVDMSNSTQGWVGKTIKESLVLLGELLEVVGDRYGIYGFSGMRRSRCELYRIKKIDEPYSELVQQRICAINPREYTRMATPIRHLTQLLRQVDARIRLLIVISDGKPEDYDDYKGEYAIEDTRQALNEARTQGVIPFCITVDRAPQAYLPHMFGRGNYIFVDGVDKLPQRLPEIYRLLTS